VSRLSRAMLIMAFIVPSLNPPNGYASDSPSFDGLNGSKTETSPSTGRQIAAYATSNFTGFVGSALSYGFLGLSALAGTPGGVNAGNLSRAGEVSIGGASLLAGAGVHAATQYAITGKVNWWATGGTALGTLAGMALGMRFGPSFPPAWGLVGSYVGDALGRGLEQLVKSR
jgi:hypothetical protein